MDTYITLEAKWVVEALALEPIAESTPMGHSKYVK